MAQQAANSHPRLKNLMKRNEIQPASTTETYQRARKETERYALTEPIARQEQIPRGEPSTQSRNQSPLYPMGGNGYQPLNPYLPPMHFNPYDAGYLKYPQLGGGNGFRDPYAMHYAAQNPYQTQGILPDINAHSRQQMNQSPYQQQPSVYPYQYPMHPHIPQQSQDQYARVRARASPVHVAYHNDNYSNQSGSYGHQEKRADGRGGRFRQPTKESKQDYAADLDRQIKEKEARKRSEKQLDRQQDYGFLGGANPIPNPSRQNQNGRNPIRQSDEYSNDGYESSVSKNSQNRLLQQNRYNRELGIGSF